MTNNGRYLYVFWTCFSIGLLIGGFLFGTHKAHGAPRLKAPVVSESRIEDSKHELVLYNPNHKKLSVTLDCGKNVEQPEVELHPRVKQRFHFSSAPCKVISWRKVR